MFELQNVNKVEPYTKNHTEHAIVTLQTEE